MTQRHELHIEAGERVRRENQAVLERAEEDWLGARLSLVRYRRLEGSAVQAVNEGLLVCFNPDGDPGTLPVRLNGIVQPNRTIRPGAMHILPPGTLFESDSPPSTRPTTYLNMVFPVEVVNEFFDDYHVDNLRPNFHFDNPFIRTLSEQLLKRVRAADTSPLYREAATRFMLASLLDTLQPRKPTPNTGGLAGWQLKRTTDFLMEHLAKDVSLIELASIADLSPYHFCRAFKQSTGLPPHAWQTVRRIERAQELMRDHPKMGLIEIALCVGYQSQAAFGVSFKRVVGIPPGQWPRESAR